MLPADRKVLVLRAANALSSPYKNPRKHSDLQESSLGTSGQVPRSLPAPWAPFPAHGHMSGGCWTAWGYAQGSHCTKQIRSRQTAQTVPQAEKQHFGAQGSGSVAEHMPSMPVSAPVPQDQPPGMWGCREGPSHATNLWHILTQVLAHSPGPSHWTVARHWPSTAHASSRASWKQQVLSWKAGVPHGGLARMCRSGHPVYEHLPRPGGFQIPT